MSQKVFIHIPKCGGTSVIHALRKSGKDPRALLHAISEGFTEIVYGHMRYEATYQFNNPEIITWLRDPIARVYSAWNFSKVRVPHLLGRKTNFLDWLEWGEGFAIDNLITRIIGGGFLPAQLFNEYVEKWIFYPVPNVTEFFFNRACERLKTIKIGFCDTMAKDLKDIFNIDKMYHKNKTDYEEFLIKDQIERIKYREHWDIKLYTYAKSLKG